MKKIAKMGWFVTLTFVTSIAFADTGARFFDPAGNFSIRPPLSWQTMDVPGLKYKFIIGPTELNFAANICFVDEYYGGSLRNYVNENLVQMEGYFKGYKLINRSSFKTNSGVIGERIIY